MVGCDLQYNACNNYKNNIKIVWFLAGSVSCTRSILILPAASDKLHEKVSAMYAEDCEPEDVLTVLACTQRLIDSNERVLTNFDDERKDYKAAIDELRSKQEQVMAVLNEIKASTSSSSPYQRERGCSSKTFINREVSVSLLPFYLSMQVQLLHTFTASRTGSLQRPSGYCRIYWLECCREVN